jgi:pyruvate,water dikinase
MLHQLEPVTAWLNDVVLDDLRQVGGKGANLGHLMRAGFRVPPGFCILAHAYETFLSGSELERSIRAAAEAMDFTDSGSVEEGAAGIRELIVARPMPDPTGREIATAYLELVSNAGENALVAVRSSVGTKDLASTSFPGQMDTYYNLRGEDEVVRKVKECWASAFSYPATVYRHARGIDFSDIFVAPVVQLMVAADSAGVIFTTNPLSDRTDQMVINSCFGLGEGVVSGKLDCDHFVVDRDTCEVLEERIGEKEFKIELDPDTGGGSRRVRLSGEECGSPSLTGDRIARLVGVALRVEESYGSPQDIEWAFQDGDLYILQSRRISATDVGDRAGAGTVDEWVSEFDSTVDPDYADYTLANISEVMPGVLTPLSITSGIGPLDYGFVKTNTDFGLLKGIDPRSEYTFLGVFYGRAHLNLSVINAVTAKLPGATTQEFERVIPGEESDGEVVKFHPTPGSLLTIINTLLRIVYRMIRTPREAAATGKAMDERIARLRERDFEKLPYGRYLARFKESQGDSERIFPLHITASQFAVVFFDSLRKMTDRWLGDTEGLLASRLVTGLHELESARPSIGIWDLSRIVRDSRELTEIFEMNEPGRILEILEASPAADAGEFMSSLRLFLDAYGYRSVFEAEMMLLNWEDDPSYVFAMIKNYLDADSDASPRNLARRQEKDRDRALDEAFGRLSAHRRLLLRFVVKQAQKYIALREFMKAVLVKGIAEVKRENHILSRRFAKEGIIREPGDHFFLTRQEVETILGGEGAGIPVEELVERRRREHERNLTVVLPECSHGRPKPLSPEELELQGDFEVLRGIAVSPGKVTGRARVITDARSNAEMKPGEILVAPVTDAAWTPLFVTASAIVVDVGGPLSHGSIVARQYGIPGVLSVRVATRLIRTGQMITVDGDHGAVYLHPAGQVRVERQTDA